MTGAAVSLAGGVAIAWLVLAFGWLGWLGG